MMAAAGLNTVRTYSTLRRHARRRILDAGRHALECAMERFTGRDSVLAIAVRLDPGHKILLAPAAQVRHQARSTLRACRRRHGTYGASERMVCGRHTHLFNRLGRSRWAGFIHGFPAFLLDCCDQSSTMAQSAARHTGGCCADRPKA